MQSNINLRPLDDFKQSKLVLLNWQSWRSLRNSNQILASEYVFAEKKTEDIILDINFLNKVIIAPPSIFDDFKEIVPDRIIDAGGMIILRDKDELTGGVSTVSMGKDIFSGNLVAIKIFNLKIIENINQIIESILSLIPLSQSFPFLNEIIYAGLIIFPYSANTSNDSQTYGSILEAAENPNFARRLPFVINRIDLKRYIDYIESLMNQMENAFDILYYNSKCHGDVKLSNIMVSKKSKNIFILVDLDGIINLDEKPYHITDKHAAPEMNRNDGKCSQYSDHYAFASSMLSEITKMFEDTKDIYEIYRTQFSDENEDFIFKDLSEEEISKQIIHYPTDKRKRLASIQKRYFQSIVVSMDQFLVRAQVEDEDRMRFSRVMSRLLQWLEPEPENRAKVIFLGDRRRAHRSFRRALDE